MQTGKGGGVQCDQSINRTTQAKGKKMERAGKDWTKGFNEQAAGEGKEAGYKLFPGRILFSFIAGFYLRDLESSMPSSHEVL